ncbi:MAG: FtsX-like permease family protein, partial [Bryobacteraceae bacterium]
AFAKAFFGSQDPVGKSFARADSAGKRTPPFLVIGLVPDARYDNLRGPILPTAFVPFRWLDQNGHKDGLLAAKNAATLAIRTANSNPLALASVLRQEVSRARPEFRVSEIHTQEQINESQTVRERLLSMLALFFAGVALLLAGIGLYGVLHYSVEQRRREIGIRMALGAQAADIVWRVTQNVLLMLLAGSLAGLALGMASVRYIASLLYQVKPTDVPMLALPALALLAAALLAALPAVVRAVRTDPVKALRVE